MHVANKMIHMARDFDSYDFSDVSLKDNWVLLILFCIVLGLFFIIPCSQVSFRILKSKYRRFRNRLNMRQELQSRPYEMRETETTSLNSILNAPRCIICLSSIDFNATGDKRGCTLECEHTFHIKCVSKWFRRNKNKRCPICRRHVHFD